MLIASCPASLDTLKISVPPAVKLAAAGRVPPALDLDDLESPAVAPHPLRLLFAENPEHPSLRFKKLHGAHPYWSVRFGSGYRAVCRRDGDKADWIWIGTHQDFDKAF